MILTSTQEKTTIIVNKYGMGEAPLELSHTLAINFFSIINQEHINPNYICFYAEGVKLTTTGSPIIQELKSLESKGCKIIVCKTCLTYYNLIEQIEVGTIGTMLDIIGTQQNSTKIINL